MRCRNSVNMLTNSGSRMVGSNFHSKYSNIQMIQMHWTFWITSTGRTSDSLMVVHFPPNACRLPTPKFRDVHQHHWRRDDILTAWLQPTWRFKPHKHVRATVGTQLHHYSSHLVQFEVLLSFKLASSSEKCNVGMISREKLARTQLAEESMGQRWAKQCYGDRLAEYQHIGRHGGSQEFILGPLSCVVWIAVSPVALLPTQLSTTPALHRRGLWW